MLFEGPQLPGEINRGLVELLHRDGFTNISQAVGKDL
jgi:dihydroorotate dehydrogenase